MIDRAIASDQGLKYVYAIDAQNKATYRRVTTGALQPDGLRVITEGLKAGEWVAVGALQQIRPNMQVQTEKMAMPTFGQPTAGNHVYAAGERSPAAASVRKRPLACHRRPT